MATDNLQRMMKLAEEFFETKDDPDQLSIDEGVLHRLKKIHPHAVSEKRKRQGPIAWMIVLPTTTELMKKFLAKTINERELLEQTPLRIPYEALYLCSALVLPEEQGKGIATDVGKKAIAAILKEHPIKAFFYWSFSAEGKRLARKLAKEFDIPLHRRRA